ncbi:class I SAM-dependent methyltransferase [Nonomuraea rubra]|uniref:class I SAM-dependent methyltransferase n=1 Tax=Nonomuraea rubra TaxID=46180 RepID=UPI003409B20F
MIINLLRRYRHTTAGLRWYRLAYQLIYRLGLTVWQRPAPPAGLVALVQGPSPLPPGHALDLDCGTGTGTIYLATHGWDVTASDMAPKALAAATPPPQA